MSFSIHPKKSKRGMKIRVHDHQGEAGHEIKEMFVGHHTILSVVGSVVGGVLIARTVWEILYREMDLGPVAVIIIGFVVFVGSGTLLHQFDDHPQAEQDQEQE